jgi:hypothetical protein
MLCKAVQNVSVSPVRRGGACCMTPWQFCPLSAHRLIAVVRLELDLYQTHATCSCAVSTQQPVISNPGKNNVQDNIQLRGDQ